MPHDWRSATLLQARSDYDMLRRLLDDSEVPLCHVLHYLQMTTEKLAKAYLTPPGGERYPKTHDAFANFVNTFKASRAFRKELGIPRSEQFRRYIQSLKSLAKKVENLSPDGGDHPNPEYPWYDNGAVIVPSEYPFIDLSLQSPKMVRLLEFIDIWFSHIE